MFGILENICYMLEFNPRALNPVYRASLIVVRVAIGI